MLVVKNKVELSERKGESSPREQTLQSHYCENACFVMCLGGGRGVKDSRGLWVWIIKAHKILLRLYPDPLASPVCSSSSCCECWLISFPSSREFPLDYKNYPEMPGGSRTSPTRETYSQKFTDLGV